MEVFPKNQTDLTNDFENEMASEEFGLLVVRVSDKVDEAFHHPGAHSFPWVDPPCYDYAPLLLLVLFGFLAAVPLTHCKQFAIEASQSLAEGLSLHEFVSLWVCLKLEQVSHHV